MKIEIVLILIVLSVFFFDFILKNKRESKGISLSEHFIEKTRFNYQILTIQLVFIFLLGMIFGTLFTHVGSGHKLITLNLFAEYYIADILEGNLAVITNYLVGFIISWCVVFWKKIVKLTSKVFIKKILAFFIVTNFLKVLIHYFIYPYKQTKPIIHIGFYFDQLYKDELWLFIPSFLIPLLIVWYFLDR